MHLILELRLQDDFEVVSPLTRACRVKAGLKMFNKMTYVASWLVLTVMMGFSPNLIAEVPHVDGAPGTPARPAADANFLKDLKYNLLTEPLLNKDFKATIKKLDGADEKDQVVIGFPDRFKLRSFVEMTKTLRVAQNACMLKGNEIANDLATKVMDPHINFLVNSFYEEKAVKGENQMVLKDDATKEVRVKSLLTLIWGMEKILAAQDKKFAPSGNEKWNADYLTAAKGAFKALTKTEYKVESFTGARAALVAAAAAGTADEKALATTITDVDETVRKIEAVDLADLSKANCVVGAGTPTVTPAPPTVTPAPTTPVVTPAPGVTPTPTPSPNANRVVITPGPLTGGNDATPTVSPTVSPAPVVSPAVTPLIDPRGNVAPGVGDNGLNAPVNLDEIVNRLNADNGAKFDAQEKALEDQARQLQQALNDLNNANRDRDALLNDDNQNDEALKAALAALGQKNDEQPIQPPPPITPPTISGGDEKGEQAAVPTPPPAEEREEKQQPFFPPPPPPLAPPPPFLFANDKKADTTPEPTRAPLPNISENAIAMATLRDLVDFQKDKIAALQGGPNGQNGPYGGRNPNAQTIASKLSGAGYAVGGGSRTGRPLPTRPLNGAATSGSQAQTASNPAARGKIPLSLQNRASVTR